MAPDGQVLIAYDGSEGAQHAIAVAAPLLAGRDAVVTTVWESVSELASASVVAIPAAVAGQAAQELDRAAEQQAQEVAEEGAALARDAGVEATARAVRCQVNAWSTLVRLAEDEQASVVVLGSRGRSGIASALLGSVSHGVANHCRQPVLVVRPPG